MILYLFLTALPPLQGAQGSLKPAGVGAAGAVAPRVLQRCCLACSPPLQVLPTLDHSTHGMRQLQCPWVGILERGHSMLPARIRRALISLGKTSWLQFCLHSGTGCGWDTPSPVLSPLCPSDGHVHPLCQMPPLFQVSAVAGWTGRLPEVQRQLRRRWSRAVRAAGILQHSPHSPPTPRRRLHPLSSPPDPLVVCSPHRVRLPSRGRCRPNL